jgi:glycosyltransferase involved in cell wall biosynthesis
VVLAWFSPLPPSTSGIAAYSAELLPLLAARGHAIDVYTEANAHEFVWRQRRRPYDLTVYQMGNAAYHDYMWAYLFRYPGLLVLHDLQLHQARALFLTKRWQPRLDDYMAEVRANHPDAPADLPYLVLARMGDRMYQHWPLIRLVIESARVTAVHNAWVANDLREKFPSSAIRAIEMGVADPLPSGEPAASRALRARLPGDAITITAFGGITPEKRIPQLIRAIAAIAPRHPNVHLVLVGDTTDHYDARADAATHGVSERVHLTGFVPDAELSAYLSASDVCACLRWPTNRETSASWLRCLAAGRPTIITELAQLGDVPTLDPRGWRLMNTAREPREPVAVSIDILDEDHSLQLALERLVVDRQLRARLGHNAREWFTAHHQLEQMATSYDALLHAAAAARVPTPSLPPHLLADGTRTLRAMVADLGMSDRVRDLL